MSVRVRFAPSPTGPLHMGGVRTALYNYLFAKQNNGTFILRIEDTDQTRFVPGAQEYILESLKWCNIFPDEGPGIGGDFGPYRQSERKDLYLKYTDQLIDSGWAYYAFDTPEELDQQREAAKQQGLPNWQYNHITRAYLKNSLTLSKEEVDAKMAAGEPYVIRFKMPRNEELKFEDRIRGWVSVNTSNLDDKILFKSDGMPTYHLANIVDDHLMEITHVIRGEEWLPSAPLHVMLYRAFGWDAPEFAHLPLILRPDGNGKLSKRDGDRLGFPVFPLNWTTSDGELYSGYREKGYYPQAFLNMLAFLGWNPGTTQEIFSLEELEKEFTLEKVGKAGARFNPDKTLWFQQQYLRMRSPEELNADLGENIDPRIIEMMKERATFPQDILTEGDYFFNAPVSYDEKTLRKKWKEGTTETMTEFKAVLTGLDSFDAESVEKAFKSFLEEKELGIGKVLPNFRLLVTGKGAGPSMFAICEILGKDEVITRMENGLNAISEASN